jgi:hypothetical protein
MDDARRVHGELQCEYLLGRGKQRSLYAVFMLGGDIRLQWCGKAVAAAGGTIKAAPAIAKRSSGLSRTRFIA